MKLDEMIIKKIEELDEKGEIEMKRLQAYASMEYKTRLSLENFIGGLLTREELHIAIDSFIDEYLQLT